MQNLIQDTIEKIKKQHIAPEPKWRYLVRRYGMWALFSLVVLFGASSLSAAYYTLTSLDWDLYRFMQQNIFSYSLSIFPYFWAILIGIFMLVAFFDIRRTETGYRFSWFKIFLIAMGSIVALGMAMSFFGFGSRVNSIMANSMPYYGQHMMVTKESQWNRPTEGFLSGTIVSTLNDELMLKDLQGNDWNVVLNEKTLIRPMVVMSQDQMIKIIGSQVSGNKFNADEIRPWAGMGRGMMSGNGQSQSASPMNSQGRGMMRGN